MSLIGRPFPVATAGGFDVANAIHFDKSASQAFSRAFGSAGDQRTLVASFIVRRGSLGTTQIIFVAGNGTNYAELYWNSSNRLQCHDYTGATRNYDLQTTAYYRDVGSVYLVQLVLDTTNSSVALWVNGEEVTDYETNVQPSLNFQGKFNSNLTHYIGRNLGGNYLDGNLSECVFLDGSADPTGLFEIADNGEWRPIEYVPTGTTASASGAYVGANYSDTNATTYTFTSEPVGAADANRLVVVGIVLTHDVTAARSVSSMTIGGIAATKVIQKNDDSASWYSVEQWAAEVPTGTTATIVVTANAACQQCEIFVYRLIDAEIYPAKQIFDDAGATLTADLPTVDNSFSVGIYMDRARAHTVTWTGLTEDVEQTGTELSAGVMGSSASASHTTAGDVTVTATPSAGTDDLTMVLANYGPRTGYGTNGFYLRTADGVDQSGKDNNFTPVNTPTDTADTPTNIYATFNPLNSAPSGLTNGNLTYACPGDQYVASTIPFDADTGGVAYQVAEFKYVSGSNGGCGIFTVNGDLNNIPLGTTGEGYAYFATGGVKVEFTVGSTAYGGAISAGKYVQVVIKNGKLYFGLDGVLQASGDLSAETGYAFSGLTGTFVPIAGNSSGAGSVIWEANFGATAFAYEIAGTVPLNSANLYANDPPAIEEGEKYFNTITYTGNGGNQRIGPYYPIVEAYTIDNSALFDASSSAYLTRTPGVAPALRQGTISFWFKLGALGTTRTLFSQWNTTTSSWNMLVRLDTGDTLSASFENSGGSNIIKRTTTQLFRDVAAWYHCVISWDSNLTTNASCTVSLNGSAVSAFTTTTNPGAATDLGFNTNALQIGRGNVSNYFDGYLANFYYIDGSVVAASSFGQFDGDLNWVAKSVSGLTYGTNGFFLDYAASGDLGNDVSGNANDFTNSNVTQVIDTPTDSYTTWNPLALMTSSTNKATLSNGALKASASGTDYNGVIGTQFPTSGKWGFQVTVNAKVSSAAPAIGIAQLPYTPFSVTVATAYAQFKAFTYAPDGTKRDDAGTSSAYGATFGATNVIECLFDIDAQTITMKKDGVSQGTMFSTLTVGAPYAPFVFLASAGDIVTIDCGQSGYTPSDSSYNALSTDNLPSQVEYNSAFTWIKSRSATTRHMLFDRVRGAGNYISSNSTDVEVYDANSLQQFFKGGALIGNNSNINTASATYVAWNWFMQNTGAGVTNTDGSITSTVLADTTAGFSVVTYTGTGATATVGHGLGKVPGMVIIKDTGASASWPVIHQYDTSCPVGHLNTTAAFNAALAASMFQSTFPSSSVITLGADGVGEEVNVSAHTYVAYCFAPIAGFSAFGSYTGNGSADGPFVYTGFKPAFVLVKMSSSTGDWIVVDTSQDPYNSATTNILYPNSTSVGDQGGTQIKDILSNGFKIRTTSAGQNTSSGTYIYAAFASVPSFGATPAKAR